MDDPVEEGTAPPSKKSLTDSYQESKDTESKELERAFNAKKASILTNIKRDITLFESSGNRGKMLELIYTALLSIPPTSVEGRLRHTFSISGTHRLGEV